MLQQAVRSLEQLLFQDRTHRGEAKAWLVSTLAQLQHISPAARQACFCPTHRSSPLSSCKDAELQLLQLLTELAPADVSTLLLPDPDWLCSFLTASRDRIKAWFGGFGPTTIQHFRYGAKALANYALAERAEAWRHLVWTGKHAQSPVAVAAKPHYFGELDVVATVHKLARSCPGFWESDALLRSCQSGEWLGLDRDAVAKELRRLLHDQRSSRNHAMQQLLSDFLASTDWGPLCHRLLPLLPDSGLLQVAQTLAADLHIERQQQKQSSRSTGSSSSKDSLLSCWCKKQCRVGAQLAAAARAAGGRATALQQQVLAAVEAGATTPAARLPCVSEPELLLLGCLQLAQQGKDAWALEQLLLANALTCYRSQLLTLLRQDEDTASHLASLAAAAAAIWPDGNSTAAGLAAVSEPKAGSGQIAGPQQLVSALQRLPQSQQLLQLLVAAWLLRLQMMRQLAGAADAAAAGQQQEGPIEVQLLTGDICYLLLSTGAAATTPVQVVPAQDVPMPTHLAQQQEQDTAQQAQQNAQQKQQPQQAVQPPPTGSDQAKAPLRRGQTPTQPARADSADGSEGGSRQRTKRSTKKSKRRSSKKHRRKRSSRHTSSGSDTSASYVDDDNSSSSGSSDGGGVRQRKKQRRRRSSSKEAGSSDDEWADLDLDGGGELLDAAAFQPKAQGTPQPSPEGKRLQQQAGSAAVGDRGARLAGMSLAAQQQGGAGLPQILDRLKSLAVGGQLWQRPLCVVELSAAAVPVAGGGSHARASGAAPSSGAATRTPGQHVLVSGSISEVADAAAQVWLCCALQLVLLA